MQGDVGEPDIVVAVDPQPVSSLDIIVTPCAKESAVALEYQDRLLATVKNEHPVRRVRRHRAYRTELDAVRQLRPIRHRPVVGEFIVGLSQTDKRGKQ